MTSESEAMTAMLDELRDRRRSPLFVTREMATYVLENGRPFHSEPLDDDEWSVVRETIRRPFMQPRRCFHNCQKAVIRTDVGFKYVEGFASSCGFVFPHAWLSLNGKVVDPTRRLPESQRYRRRKFADRVMGEFPETDCYFGAVLSLRDACVNFGGSALDAWEQGWPLLRGER